MNLVVVGGAGALGRNIIQKFKAAGNNHIINVDYVSVDDANKNIIIRSPDDQVNLECNVALVICVAGSWKPTAKPFSYTNTLATWQALEASNIKPALLAASLASYNDCRLVLTSAAASSHACPGMVEYGMVKAAINMLGKSVRVKGGVLVMMPAVLDTPANRRDMPGADTSNWTPLDDISSYLLTYKPDSSDCEFVTIKTANGKTSFEKTQM